MQLEAQIADVDARARAALEECADGAALEEIHSRFLGKKGELTGILKGLKDLAPEERKTVGQLANQTREGLQQLFNTSRKTVEERAIAARLASEHFDALRPVAPAGGSLHPHTIVQNRVEDIFVSMGFVVMDGPEVETDENNFGKLNFSDDHPARDMQDTFWTADGNLLRTHTSPVQIRTMQELEPPIYMIAPGRVYRYEELDASHQHTFFQIEGMMIDRDISVANLLYVMRGMLSRIFERDDVKVRVRPGYFPFVEPGLELDFQCLICGGDGCSVCKHLGWVEMGGSGLVHPNVLRSGGLDPDEWSGFAFGFGLDRLVMMLYEIEDIRHFLSGNLRFLKQF